MVMTAADAVNTANDLLKTQDGERQEFDILRRYWTGRQGIPAVIPASAPREVHEMARVARVNIIKIAVESVAQSLFIDTLRATDGRDDAVIARAWAIWQRNGMDRRQSGLFRAVTAYGTAYRTILPGTGAPVMRSVSPRSMTALYGDDDLWPELALERRSRGAFRLYDDEAVYAMRRDPNSDRLELAGPDGDAIRLHGAQVDDMPVTPVVRHRDAEDLDEDDEPTDMAIVGTLGRYPTVTAGHIAPLLPLQDQINLTSFSLKAAEWYGAFRQRWMIGVKPLTAGEKIESAASQVWAIDQDPDRVRLGEFAQSDLRGFIESRAESMKFAATLSQTPVHELIGELVNLSAEALAAAEIGRDRMVGERKTGLGESHEQDLRLAVAYEGMTLPDDVQVGWRDTSARAFGAVVDGLGKIAQMLQVPPQELWERIPGATKQDVERWRKAWAEGDSLTQMTNELERQAAGGAGTGGERTTPGGIILPAGVGA